MPIKYFAHTSFLHLFLFFFSLTFIFSDCKTPTAVLKPVVTSVSQKSINAKKAVVACAHPIAAKIGVDIMKQGGNAIDASIAVQLALAVVYPRAGNIGGGGFLVYRSGNGKEINTLDFRERAPSGASRDMYLDEKGNVIPDKSTRGPLAAGVPGTVEGCYQMFLKYSKLKNWKKLVQPAIDIANNGFTITESEAKRLNEMKTTLLKFSSAPSVFIKTDEKVWQTGDILIQKDLAKTLVRVRDRGIAGFYEGETANLIVAEMKKGGGIVTLADLKNYTSVWRKPLIGQYRGYEIIGMPPPSSGGIALMQLLIISEDKKLNTFPFHSPESMHLIVESERRVYADRAEYLGDPEFFKVPQNQLLDKNYLRERMKDFDRNKATSSKQVKAGSFAAQSEQTTHISIVDGEGNATSITTTLNDNYGCRTVVAGAGFILNNEMDDFSVKPGVPNLYGAIGGEANSIQPLKHPLSSMTPTIVAKNGKLFMVVGTPGGTTIITSVFQVITNVIDYKMTMFDAVQAPRFHSQWMPDIVMFEKKGLIGDIKQQLEKKGHKIMERPGIGLVEAILVNPDGTLEGAADGRSDDDAEGY